MVKQEAYKNLKESLDQSNITLVAVSKMHPIEKIKDLYDLGHRIFGENKAQELKDKQPQLPDDIKWHFIGHMQRNKVKYIAPFVELIHSVDSERLLKEINKQAKKNERVIDCLLQIHIAGEETKFGFDYTEAEELIKSGRLEEYSNVRICGLMGMATNTDDQEKVKKEFNGLKEFFDKLKSDYFSDKEHFSILSMGMSGDYELAIEEGSNMVRVGSLIFGERNYAKP